MSAAPAVAVQGQRVHAETFARPRDRGDAVVVDVRGPAEFAQAHIPGAINLNVNSEDFTSAIRQLEQDRPVLVYCRSGRRSTHACSILEEAGFTELLELAPGLRGWEASGPPVER